MYSEEFDELSGAENKPPRTYVSTAGQDASKLQRENERLKKSLEKEQFFNRLLDQELKEIKSSQEGGSNYNPDFQQRSNGVSRTAFNTLLVITIAMAVFLAYTVLFNKQYDLFQPSAVLTSNGSSAPVAPVTDSVPTIIAEKKSNSLPAFREKSAPDVSARNTTEKTIAEPSRQPAAKSKSDAPVEQGQEAPAAAQQAPVTPPPAQQSTTSASPQAPAVKQPDPVEEQAPAERQVIGTYMVSSKANFYSAPDENTLRSYFISPGADKLVNALDEKNGFIYVEFKNDVGYVTKGWLSKADLTKQ